MRAFSTLFIAAAFALSANAASVSKRDISPAVQLCLDSITSAGAQLEVVNTAVLAFTSSVGIIGANKIHTLEQVLETRLKKAGTDCCVQIGAITLPEADAVLATVEVLVPKVTSALSAITSKKSQFDAIFLATAIVKNDIKALDTQTKTLDACLIAKTPIDPPSYLITANGYVTEINNAFSAARSAYGI
ncbi:hypothetical protein EDC94DRAFT_620250 [Helicostylum pulchrum]|uniref:Cell wall galactomannoprotein n=1 Tax=Helicostylum pulchrum TaxID=562976 RepID=A0ABP9YCT8_9FUNG|nr:hypothetical protein EDC94DRAFT_620250 [Helicostylum pulchrum]